MSVKMDSDYKFGNREYKSSTIDCLQDLNRMAASGKLRRMGDNLVSRKEEVSLALSIISNITVQYISPSASVLGVQIA